MSQYIEATVAQADTLQNGQTTQVKVGETQVLLARIQDQYYAVSAHCTHYGAPLVEGSLCGRELVCPWHHARFDLTTGRHLVAPGLDRLPRYEVRVEGSQVVVRVPQPSVEPVPAPVTGHDPSDTRLMVVLGAGAAGAYAVEALREAGFRGRLVMITREAEPPYDRPNCSKNYLQGEITDEQMPLRRADFYQERDIERWTACTVRRVDTTGKTIYLENGDPLRYDALLVATGGKVRPLEVPGAGLPGVYGLRTWADSRQLREIARQHRRLVVIGASFIGMEGAWSLRQLGCQVTVVSPDPVPFKQFGERVGRMLRGVHEKNGVIFRLQRKVVRLEGLGKVARVVLDNGESLETDAVLLGIGVRPATDVIEGVQKHDDNGLVADAYLRVADGLYAAGDIAHVPYRGKSVRVEHWRVACQQGRVAAQNMAGQPTPYDSIPFFWSAQFGLNLRYLGHAREFDEIYYDGQVEAHDFIAYYANQGGVQAVLGLKRDTDLAAIHQLMKHQRMPPLQTIKAQPLDWPAYLVNAQVPVVSL